MSKRSFLVFSNNERVATSVSRGLSVYRRTRWIQGSAEESFQLPPPLGVVFAAESNPTEALEVLARLRRLFTYVPAIVLSNVLTAGDVERAYALRASHLPLYTGDANVLLPFVFRCLTEEAVCDERVGCLVRNRSCVVGF